MLRNGIHFVKELSNRFIMEFLLKQLHLGPLQSLIFQHIVDQSQEQSVDLQLLKCHHEATIDNWVSLAKSVTF